MNKNIKVSIIMPVYNAVQYIDKAICSVLNQSYRNFELIIIDDGATDGTGEICKKYSEENANITYVAQKNAGVCAARNKGIEMASGDYIAFSDHDDEYLSTYLENLVELASTENLDVVKCGVFFEEAYADGRVITKKEKFEREILSQNELVDRYNFLPASYFGVWNTLYRTEILKKSGITFPENIKHGQEDYFFNTEIIQYINKIGFSEQCLYKHYRRLSQSTSAKYYEDRILAMSDYLKLECTVLRNLVDEKKWEQAYALLYARKITGVLSYVNSTIENCNIKKQCEILKKYIKTTPYDNQFSPNILWKLLVHRTKYAVVLYLVRNNRIKLLIRFWTLKNKQSCL